MFKSQSINSCSTDPVTLAFLEAFVSFNKSIASKSFDLDFENRVHSIMFSVLDRLFPHLPQIITTIKGCVTCEVYNKTLKFQFLKFFKKFSAFTLKKNLQFCLHSFHICQKSSLASEGVSHVMTFDLDLYFHSHSALTLKIVSAL